MNEEELSLRVQKNWVRIKHETLHIREKVMDRLLEDGAVTVEEMRVIKSKARDDQFDFLLYRLIESRKCKALLRVLETYGRRPLCVAIRKTDLTPEDFNTTTTTILHEVKQRSADVQFDDLTRELKGFHAEIGQTVTNLTQHVDEMGQRMEVIDTKMDSIAIRKKDAKKKSVPKNTKGARAGVSTKLKEDSERLRKLVWSKGDEVIRLKSQLQAKSEEIKWLKKQLEDKETSGKSLTASLQKSKDDKLAFQRRLYDSKKEQLDLSNLLLENERITKELRERIRTIEDEIPGVLNEGQATPGRKCTFNDVNKETIDKSQTLTKKRVTFQSDSTQSNGVGPLVQEMARALEAVLEERESVNKEIRLKNAETLKLTVYLRTQTDENDRLRREARDSMDSRSETQDRIRRNDLEITETKERLSSYMQQIEELSEKLKPITEKEREITKRLRELENDS